MHKSLVRLFLTASLMLASAGSAWAIKANPRPVAVRLPDGSTLTVRIHGDENFNYVTTLDGFLVQRDREGYFRYVRVRSAFTLTTVEQLRKKSCSKPFSPSIAWPMLSGCSDRDLNLS